MGRCFANLSHFALASITTDIVFSAVGIVLGFIFAHMGWFCIVRRDGCCGSIGYLIWALVYILLNAGPLSRGDAGLIYLAMLVPVGYMIFSLFKLFQSNSS